MNIDKKSYVKWIYIVIPLILWSSHAVFIRFLVNNDVGIFELISYRSIAPLILGIILAGKTSFRIRSLRDFAPGFILLFNFLVFNTALKYIDAYLLIIMESSCFVFSLIFDRLLKMNPFFSRYSFAIYIGGISILLIDALTNRNIFMYKGLFFAFLVSASFGLFNSTLHFIGDRKNKLVLMMLPMFLVCLPFSLMRFGSMPDTSTGYIQIIQNLLLIILISGVFQTAIPYLFWSKAAGEFAGVKLSEFSLITIPGTFIVEYLTLGVSINIYQIAASLLLVSANFLNFHLQARQNKQPFQPL